MRCIFIYILIGLCWSNNSVAQDIAVYSRIATDGSPLSYSFIQREHLRSDLFGNGIRLKTSEDTLNLFISDSVKFHRQYGAEFIKHPHICQNRFYKMGFVGIYNNTIIPFEFEFLRHQKDPKQLLGKKKRWYGLLSETGEIIFPFDFANILNLDRDLYGATKNETDSSIYFYNEKADFLFKAQGSTARILNEKYIVLSNVRSTVTAVYDRTGKQIIPPGIFSFILSIQGDAVCGLKDGKYGVSSLAGKSILPFEYSRITILGTSNFIVMKEGKFAVLSSKNKLLVPFEYDLILPGVNKQLIARKDRRYGVIGQMNNLLFPFDSLWLQAFGVFYISSTDPTGRKGLINTVTREVIAPKYDIGTPGWDGIERVAEDNTQRIMMISESGSLKKGIYRADGLMIAPVDYNFINWQQDRQVFILGKYGKGYKPEETFYTAVDINGRVIAGPDTNKLSMIDANAGLLLSTHPSGKSAFVNVHSGKVTTAYEYDYAGHESLLGNGYVVARKNFRFAVISPAGKVLTQAIYERVTQADEAQRTWFDAKVIGIGMRDNKLFGITPEGKELTARMLQHSRSSIE